VSKRNEPALEYSTGKRLSMKGVVAVGTYGRSIENIRGGGISFKTKNFGQSKENLAGTHGWGLTSPQTEEEGNLEI